MSRSGYTDNCCDTWAHIRWRGAVTAAIRGKRGQAFLKELLNALDALPEKKLIREELQDSYDRNVVCALGAVGRLRGIDMEKIDPHDASTVAGTFGIPDSLAREIMYENDDAAYWEITPEKRFQNMRQWVVNQIRDEP